MIEAVRRRNTNEKAMARLNSPDDLRKYSPACHKIIPSGSLSLRVIHRSLDKVVVGAVAPQSGAVYFGSLEKKLGDIGQGLGGPVAAYMGIRNLFSGALRVIKICRASGLTLFWRSKFPIVVRLPDYK